MDSTYKPVNFRFASKGIIARNVQDACPPETYLNLLGCEERQENALSSRLGTLIISRDPNGTMDGQNYPLAAAPVSLARLAYGGNSFRYAGDAAGNLYRRTGDTQGAYTNVLAGLSGNRFSTAVNNCFASSQPYLFIADDTLMLKDSGTGTPSKWGIRPPLYAANITPTAPNVLMIESFLNPFADYVISDLESWVQATFATINAGAVNIVNDFSHYVSDNTVLGGFNGALGVPVGGSGLPPLAALFDLIGTPYAFQFSAVGLLSGSLSSSAVTGFTLGAYTGAVAASQTGTVGRTVALDLNQNNQVTDDDLIVFTLQVSDPNNIETIELNFDINGSNFTTSYFSKTISPQYYSSPTASTSFDQIESQIYAIAAGLISGTPVPNSALQPASLSTGENAWVTIYIRRGDFVPVGTAGNSGYGWDSVTGWQLSVTTNTSGSATFASNGIYLQWNQGPSSYGGTGFDYRYTYWNQNAFTESNGSQLDQNDVTYGACIASAGPLIVLRQPIWVAGQYSSNPQTTHIRVYRRGGQYNTGWIMVQQFPNVVGTGFFSWLDTIPDAYLAQANQLALDNDVPVTSSLPVPIQTTLTAATIAPATTNGINTLYDVFVPQSITVAGEPTFVVGQIVDIGNPVNLEQVRVIVGGIGAFTGIVRLQHEVGEPVYVYSIPEQSCDILAVANNGQMYMAGDKNNTHFLYYTKEGYPENCGPQNYIVVGTPDSPITIVANYRGVIVVATTTKWYQIVQGQKPYPQPTGAVHGCIAKHGWALVEGAIWFRSLDGLRQFVGADGQYISLPIEWIFTNDPATPIALADNSQAANNVMALRNNSVYFVYAGTDGHLHQLVYELNYRRFRNNDIPATAIFREDDTNLLLYGTADGLIHQDRYGDYDDGGWVAGKLVQTPITMAPQLPYQDVGAPHDPKQWNTVEIDANTAGQALTVILATDNNADLNLGTVTSTSRQKLQLAVNGGDGIEAYRLSLKLSMPCLVAPEIYQADIYEAVLAPYRTSFDVYWVKMGTDESKMAKIGYFDYTSTAPILVSLYKDSESAPYFQFTLPAAPQRAGGPIQQKFPACTFRLWRMIATSTGNFRLWQNPKILWKRTAVGQSWADLELTV